MDPTAGNAAGNRSVGKNTGTEVVLVLPAVNVVSFLPGSVPRGRCVGVLGLRFALPQGVAASFWPAVAAAAMRDFPDVAASLWLAVAAAEIRSFQAVHLTCMIVTVSGNLPHIDFTVA